MAQDLFQYDKMVERALRGVVRDALQRAAKEGLRGAHHFYVGFATELPGVTIPDYLREKYQGEMTIVLQHQFWDLIVGEDRFEVGLSFGGSAERLIVPFRAITGFADPSVQFGLQFSAPGDEEEAGEEPAAEKKSGHRPPARHERPPGPAQALPTPANPGPDAKPPAKADEAPASGGEVVRLDRFRKK